MKKNIKAIRGMNDSLPEETIICQYVEETLKKILISYGYREIRFPIIENTLLFKRAIGEVTDVVEKEMYTFKDKKGDSLTLRPEGTAGCVRAGIEHGILYNQKQRLWYLGPMFRYERPQKGRYRQFDQLGVEVFGLCGPDIEVELIALSARFWRILGINKCVSLELNSLGSVESRIYYRNALIIFLEKNIKKLDEDCKRRIYSNPLRVLDSKNPDIQILLNHAPLLSDYLDKDSSDHFTNLCNLLKEIDIPYTINRRLVRGLDYYNRTVFEWVTTKLGTQGTICAGGRYDKLVETLGGNSIPAIGFSIGFERLILLIKLISYKLELNFTIDMYLIFSGKNTQTTAVRLSEHIHDVFPTIKLVTNYGGGNFKKQFSRADKLGARFVLILGESEVATGKVAIKDLQSGKQVIIMQSAVSEYLRTLVFKKKS